MMDSAIQSFPKQFAFKPAVVGRWETNPKAVFIVAGMGGSALAARLLGIVRPKLRLMVWSDYGLPDMTAEELGRAAVIAVSYSGNTEETLSAFGAARERKLPLAVVSVGGELLRRAKAEGVPLVELPDTHIQPRMALGYIVKALLFLSGDEGGLRAAEKLASTLDVARAEEGGKALAKKIRGHIPIIYASNRNAALTLIWKIKFNETGKIPAFSNVFPELNHNEMTGFDVIPATEELSEKFHFIFLRDQHDNPRIIKRMAVMKSLYEKRGLHVEIITLEGKSVWEKVFQSLLLADWAAFYIADHYGTESEQVPMVEEFKKLIS